LHPNPNEREGQCGASLSDTDIVDSFTKNPSEIPSRHKKDNFVEKNRKNKIVKTCGEPITRLELGYFTLHPNPNERTDRVVRH
jgi:hypothetical protein